MTIVGLSANGLTRMTTSEHNQEIGARLDFDSRAANFSRAMAHLDNAATRELDRGQPRPRLRELVGIRASQFNGCAYCIDMHQRRSRERRDRTAALRLERLQGDA
jgi:AhpD family alkylhydroperoxidase